MRQAAIIVACFAILGAIAYFFFPAKPADGKCMAWLTEKDGSKSCVMKDAPRLK